MRVERTARPEGRRPSSWLPAAFGLGAALGGALIAGALAGTFASRAHAGPEPGAPESAEQFLDALERLVDSPDLLREAARSVAERDAATRARRESLGASVAESRARLAEAEARRDELQARLGAIRATERLIDEIGRLRSGTPAVAVSAGSHDGARLYADRVRPLFEAHCATCHNPGRARGGFDASGVASILRGGDAGPAVVPGDPDASLLYRMVAHLEKPHMPHKEPKLPDAEIAAIAEWIRLGAPGDDPPVEAEEPARKELQVTAADRDFWSFRRLARPTPPGAGRDPGGTSTPPAGRLDAAASEIDRFLDAKLAEKGLVPVPEADRRTLIRRLTFDLTGLPPTPEEIEAFAADPDPGAYEKLVERLLASPSFGERWARHWLDVARYADSGGYEFDYDRPTAWPYRDFVIRAMNDDLPYDRFVQWQLAGDEYAPDDPMALAALGFGAARPSVDNQESEQIRADELDEIVGTTGSAMLGLTVACARCHDHKYDPIPARDYYRMTGAFVTAKARDVFMTSRAEEDAYHRALEEHKRRIDVARRDFDEFANPLRDSLRAARIRDLKIPEEDRALLLAPRDEANLRQKELLEEHKKALETPDSAVRMVASDSDRVKFDLLKARLGAAEKSGPEPPPRVLGLTDTGRDPAENWLLGRGDAGSKLEKLELGFLQCATPADSPWLEPKVAPPDGAKTTYRRRALAEWMTDVEKGAGPLLARVMINRVWQRHFGEGIVRTPSDFGAQGDRPTHPELLEWLASEFVARGWSMKAMHRMIVTSAAYRRSAEWNPENARIDPENRFLWRRTPLRLEAEAIRDAMMLVSGTLNPTMYGPPIQPKMHPDAIATGSTKKWPILEADGPETWRRSVYVFVKRSVMMPMLESFDAPNGAQSCARRPRTVIPQQALELMNGDFAIDQARRLATRLRQASPEPGGWIERGWRVALGRPPAPAEAEAALGFLAAQTESYLHAMKEEEARELALADLCQAIWGLNEFVFVD